MKIILVIFFISFFCNICVSQTDTITISSKNFTESYILAEIFARTIKDNFPSKNVELNSGMGGTGLLYSALTNGEIDLYPEYTGTIAEAVLKKPELRNFHEINEALLPLGLTISKPLGFNNTYAFAVSKETAKKYSLNTISDLTKLPDLRFGFSYEFLERSDGYYALAKRYGLKQKNVHGMQHSLAYEAIKTGAVDLIDVYSTDVKINKLGLKTLKDDLTFFPRYDAVILASIKFVRNYPAIWKQLKSLENRIDESKMIRLNALVEFKKYSFEESATSFFQAGLRP